MAYQMKLVSGRPQLDSLPVGKIVDYPQEKRDYRPFAQFRMCANEEGLHLYLWAFESKVSPKSALRACLDLGKKEGTYLQITFYGDKTASCQVFREDALTEEWQPKIHSLQGEDLQGVYWGGQYLLSWEEIRRIFDREPLQAGEGFRGNLYKICEDEAYFHHGCFYPVDFSSPHPYGEEFFGVFVLER